MELRTYDVYGNGDHITGTEKTPFQYTGSCGVQTDENGLMYMCTRYYNPEIMRFLSADVLTGDVKNTQSLNRYAYCQGNPISFTDPFGMSPEVRAHNEKERAKAVRQTVSLRVHNVLDVGGMFPALCVIIDVSEVKKNLWYNPSLPLTKKYFLKSSKEIT